VRERVGARSGTHEVVAMLFPGIILHLPRTVLDPCTFLLHLGLDPEPTRLGSVWLVKQTFV
jgi:hypothetical protein